MLNSAKPMPSWANPNASNSNKSCRVMSNGWANGNEITELIAADSSMAGAIAISE